MPPRRYSAARQGCCEGSHMGSSQIGRMMAGGGRRPRALLPIPVRVGKQNENASPPEASSDPPLAAGGLFHLSFAWMSGLHWWAWSGHAPLSTAGVIRAILSPGGGAGGAGAVGAAGRAGEGLLSKLRSRLLVAR